MEVSEVVKILEDHLSRAEEYGDVITDGVIDPLNNDPKLAEAVRGAIILIRNAYPIGD